MSDAVVTLLAGLGGALIGALAAIGAQWLANRHARQAERRRQLVELLSKFWDVTDRLWAVTKSLRYTIHDMQASQQAGHSDRVPDLDEQRLNEIAQSAALDSEAGFLVAQMRLLGLPLVDAAAELRKASRFVSVEHSLRLHEERDKALSAYESAASALLDQS